VPRLVPEHVLAEVHKGRILSKCRETIARRGEDVRQGPVHLPLLRLLGRRSTLADSPVTRLALWPPDDGLTLLVTVNDKHFGSPTCYTVSKRIIDDFVGPPSIEWEKRTCLNRCMSPRSTNSGRQPRTLRIGNPVATTEMIEPSELV
jgi:hypothetical protein